MSSRSSFRDGYLSGESFSSERPSSVALRRLDLLILGVSEQSRCCEITKAGQHECSNTVVLGVNDQNEFATKLIDYAGPELPKKDLLQDTADDDEVLVRLKNKVRSLYIDKGEPLKVGVDLTCVSAYVSLGLVAYLMETGIACKFSAFYAEGSYPEESAIEDEHDLFTAGDWKPVAIPDLRYPWILQPNRMYVVAVGFEGNKTLRLCERREADCIHVLFPDPGVSSEYVEWTRVRNAALIERFGIEDSELLRANAADAIEAWKTLTDRNVEDFDRCEVEYLCCGTKPHSLAIALRSLCTRQGVVSDIVADEKLPADVEPVGVYWRYEIRNGAAL